MQRCIELSSPQGVRGGRDWAGCGTVAGSDFGEFDRPETVVDEVSQQVPGASSSASRRPPEIRPRPRGPRSRAVVNLLGDVCQSFMRPLRDQNLGSSCNVHMTPRRGSSVTRCNRFSSSTHARIVAWRTLFACIRRSISARLRAPSSSATAFRSKTSTSCSVRSKGEGPSISFGSGIVVIAIQHLCNPTYLYLPLRAVELAGKTIGPVKGEAGRDTRPLLQGWARRRVRVAGDSFGGGLTKEGREVVGYDPRANEAFRAAVPGVDIAKDVSSALAHADVCIVHNDWPQWRDLTAADFSRMRTKVVVDGRRILRGDVNLDRGAERARPDTLLGADSPASGCTRSASCFRRTT